MRVVCLAIVTALVPTLAAADVHYQGDAQQCPSAASVHTALRARLADLRGDAGAPAARESSVDFDATVHARRDADGQWTARIRVGGNERIVRGRDCAEVTAAAVLVVALAAVAAGDGRTDAEPPPLQRPTFSATPRPPRRRFVDSGPVGPDSDVTAVRSREPLRLSARVTGGVSGGLLPGVGPTLGVGLALGSPGWRAELEAGHQFDRAAEVTGMSSRALGVDVRSSAVTARGCGAVLSDLVWLCGAVATGAMTARPFGVDFPTPRTSPWLALGGAVQGAVPLRGGLRLVFGVDVLATALRPRFELLGAENLTVFEPLPVSAQGTTGIEVRWR